MIAEPWLNILSNQNPEAVFDTEKQTAKHDQAKNEQLRSDLSKVTEDLAMLKGQFETVLKAKIAKDL